MTALALGRLKASPLTVVACAAFAALMTGIAVNALFLQRDKHPAPIFRTAPVAAPAPQAAAPAAAPAPAQQVAHAAPAQGPAVVAPPAQVQPAPAPRAAAATPPARPSDLGEQSQRAAAPVDRTKLDPIGQLLRGGSAPAEAANKTVMSAQRALAKLGYDVRADGVMGAATRQAVERFERQNNLPVTGEFSARTLRRLSAAAGMPVE